MSTISVIIPAYNTAAWLDRAIRNIAEEQFGNSPAELWEIIVVNDGSTDRTEAIAQEWAGRLPYNIRVITQPNQGVSAARNRGIDEARGEYVYFMDSDDLLRKNSLPALLHQADESGLDMLAFNYLIITPDQYNEMNDDAPSPVIIPQATPMRAFEYFNITNGSEPPFGFWVVWRAIYRKNYITGNNIRFETDMICGEDSLFMLHLLLTNPLIGVVASTLYFYNNLRPNNATTAINREHLLRFTLNRVEYVNRIQSLKPVIESTSGAPLNLFETIDFSTRCYFKMISVDAIMLGASLRKLMRLRRWYKNMGGKVKPGSPRFFNKARKYTATQKTKRWLFAFPLMTFAGLYDKITGRGLWQDPKRKVSIGSVDSIDQKIHYDKKASLAAIITGNLKGCGNEAINAIINRYGQSSTKPLVWAYEMDPETEIRMSQAGFSVFAYGRFNDIENPGPRRQSEVLQVLARLDGVKKILLTDDVNPDMDILSVSGLEIDNISIQ